MTSPNSTVQTNLPQKDRYYLPHLCILGTDFLILVSVFWIAFAVRFFSPIQTISPAAVPDFEPYFWLSMFVGLFGIFVHERFGLYERRIGFVRQVWSGIQIIAVLVIYIFVMAFLFNYRGYTYSRLTVALSIPLTCVGVLGMNALLRHVQSYFIDQGMVFWKTALVGPAERCQHFAEQLLAVHGSEYQVQGFFNSSADGSHASETLPCLGGEHDISRSMKAGVINRVVIAHNPENRNAIDAVIQQCKSLNLEYRLVPDIYDRLASDLDIEAIDALPLVVFEESNLTGWGVFVKRSSDLVISSLALIVLSPLMAMIAILIRLDSKGSVFYVQERVGNDGRKFPIYKFRSMVDQAEGKTGPVWATSNDPRTTRVGRFLRQYNLDELPQFYNVLRGDMSVVGPRPERPYFVNKFKNEIPNYMRRHVVKSGITGWAQVNGWRGDTSVDERTRHDVYYVENWTLFLDLRIMLKTLVSFKNAY